MHGIWKQFEYGSMREIHAKSKVLNKKDHRVFYHIYTTWLVFKINVIIFRFNYPSLFLLLKY